jgi:hypothetical protein
VAKSSFKKFMATIANASLLPDLELQREQELAKRVRFRSECFRKERCEPLTQRPAATSWISSH